MLGVALRRDFRCGLACLVECRVLVRGLEACRDVAMLLPYCIVEEAFELFTLAQHQ